MNAIKIKFKVNQSLNLMYVHSVYNRTINLARSHWYLAYFCIHLDNLKLNYLMRSSFTKLDMFSMCNILFQIKNNEVIHFPPFSCSRIWVSLSNGVNKSTYSIYSAAARVWLGLVTKQPQCIYTYLVNSFMGVLDSQLAHDISQHSRPLSPGLGVWVEAVITKGKKGWFRKFCFYQPLAAWSGKGLNGGGGGDDN